ncbi:MAG: metallophosphoesterase [Leptospiraceae bacterium]|nr:metallophosphoesterase [Leptospiraceae bacterium]
MFFFSIVTTIITLIYVFIGWRVLGPLPVTSATRYLLWTGLIALAWSIPLSFAIRINFPRWPYNDLLAWVSYLNLGFFTLLASLLVVKEILWVLWSVWQSWMGPQPDPVAVTIGGMDRRHFLQNTANALTGVIALFTGAFGFYQARFQFRLEQPRILIPDLHPDLEGFRIVQISDVHIGPTLKQDFLDSIVQKVNRLNADVIAITGDLVDGPVERLGAIVARLSQLQSRYGSYFVHGNHEFYSGFHAWDRALRQMDLKVLNNEHRIIAHGQARLLLAGVTDLSASARAGLISDPDRSLAGAPSHDLRVLLAHQPNSIDAASRAGFHLQLSGHTHGGQYFPGNILIHLFQRYVRGLYRHANTWLYVNRGTGYWGPPLRIGAPPEITLVTLQRASS